MFKYSDPLNHKLLSSDVSRLMPPLWQLYCLQNYNVVLLMLNKIVYQLCFCLYWKCNPGGSHDERHNYSPEQTEDWQRHGRALKTRILTMCTLCSAVPTQECWVTIFNLITEMSDVWFLLFGNLSCNISSLRCGHTTYWLNMCWTALGEATRHINWSHHTRMRDYRSHWRVWKHLFTSMATSQNYFNISTAINQICEKPFTSK